MISNICFWIAKAPKDKILHFFISYFIFDLIFSILEHSGLYVWFNVLVAFSAVTVFIFLKEFVDELEYNGWDWTDILADYLGVILKFAILLLTIL